MKRIFLIILVLTAFSLFFLNSLRAEELSEDLAKLSKMVAENKPYYYPKPDGEYDYNNVLVDPAKMDIQKIFDSVVTFTTETTFEAPVWIKEKFPKEKHQVNKRIEGHGMLVGKKYIFTVSHVVVSEPLYVTVRNPFEPTTSFLINKISEETFIKCQKHVYPLKLKRLYINERNGVAIFQIPKWNDDECFPSYPYNIGDSDKLKLINLVYAVGNPGNHGNNIRPGVVSALRVPFDEGYIKKENFFAVSNNLFDGDSGTPIIAVMDGDYEVVGFSDFVVECEEKGGVIIPGWGSVIRVNVFRDTILNKCGSCSDDLKKLFQLPPAAK